MVRLSRQLALLVFIGSIICTRGALFKWFDRIKEAIVVKRVLFYTDPAGCESVRPINLHLHTQDTSLSLRRRPVFLQDNFWQLASCHMDYYVVFGVKRDATTAQLRTARKKLFLEVHPDKNKDPRASTAFSRAQEAYEVIYFSI